MPTEDSYLGEIRWSKRWHVGSQASAAFVAVFIGLMAYPLLTFVTRVREFQPIYFAPSIIVAAFAYWLVRPTTYTAYIGSYGVLRTCAHGFKVTPLGFAFAAKRAFEDYAKQGGPYRS